MAGSPAAGILSRAIGAVARAVHRLVHPQYAEEAQRARELSRLVERSLGEQRTRVEQLREEVRDLRTAAGKAATRQELRGVDQSLQALVDAVGRQYRITTRALRHMSWVEEQRLVERRLKRRLARMAAGDRPILVGPWSGEVGFELLYWIPFLTWAVRTAGLPADRLVVLSRGGAEPWYGRLGARYLDLLSFFTPAEFRSGTEAAKKQWTMSPLDRRAVRRATEALGGQRPHLLHPGVMYRLFMPYWKAQATRLRVEEFTTHAPIRVEPLPGLAARLPERYIAVRFYFSRAFPDTPDNRAFARTVLAAVSATDDVVLLGSPFQIDDHDDVRPEAGGRIHRVDDLMTPATNLAVQTAVIAGARAFVGTYGGYAYLAPMLGVRALAFHANQTFFAHHLDFARHVFREPGYGSLTVLDVQDLDLLREALSQEQPA